MSKILYLSDFDLVGSGYLNLSVPLCNGLWELGHEVICIGWHYKGEEHEFDFGLIPCNTFQEVLAMIANLYQEWHFDVLVVALDISIQKEIIRQISGGDKLNYIGIMPVESDPLTMEWASWLIQMNKPFIISGFGANEAQKAGVLDAEHLQIGIDPELYRIPTEEQRNRIRESFGFDDGTFVILTIADNQERKLLSRTFEIVEGVKDNNPDLDLKWILVTREHNPVGYCINDLVIKHKLQNVLMMFERGMAASKIWTMYALSDMYLITSKAEGLNMPLIEAMACGLPTFATDATANIEHLSDNRGVLLDIIPEATHIDPFGNGNRYFVDAEKAVESIQDFITQETLPEKQYYKDMIVKAKEYTNKRDWKIAVNQLNKAIENIVKEK